MNNLVIVGMTTGPAYVALSSTPLRASGTLVCGVPTDAIGDYFAFIEGVGGTDVALPFGVRFSLERIDLSKIKIKSGAPGAVPVSFIGYSIA